MSTQGEKYVAPKRIRMDIPVPYEELEEVKRLAAQHYTSTAKLVRQLVNDGLNIWTKER